MKGRSLALRLLQRRLRHASSHFEEDQLPDYYDWIECIRARKSLDICSHLWFNNTDDNFNFQNDNLSSRNISSSSPASSIDEEAQRKLYRAVVPVMLTACVLSLLFNLMILFSLKWIRKTLSPTLLLSLSLAVADAYASLVIGVGLVLNSLLPIVYGVDLGPFHACYLLVLEAFRLGGMVVAVLHLLALAINHYIGILRPLHYAAIVTRGTVLWAITSMWVVPVVFFLSYFSLVPDDGFQSPYCSSYQFLLHVPFRGTVSILFFVPLLFMSVMYLHMFIVVKRHQRGVLQLPTGRQLHKSVKAIITTLLILGTYVVGWMPAVLFFVLTCLDCPVPYTQIQLWVRVPVSIFINSMIVIKSFLDPIIYVVRMPEIKGAMNAVYRTRCGCIEDERVDHRIHFKSEMHRLTFMEGSRRNEVGLKSSICNGQVQSSTY
ncbi:adrenocorticotropic hormone receptor-like [Parasteatoda tepidariorum]|uniref:adrenocorticotropic hormone receptor-like n=1 Tax=Parasteatoda tepidariorum TaxID=114398 RepID=UPI00077FDB8B|nr:adrenocorticotropic hormone receptor-like [Parasteatoda tepidariorum]